MFASHECTCADGLCELAVVAGLVRHEPFGRGDISDGLVADLEHICRSSGVSAYVSTRDVPINDDVKTLCDAGSLEWALFGGDDYHLCFTVPEHLCELVDGWSAGGLLDLKQIGRMTSCKGGVPQ